MISPAFFGGLKRTYATGKILADGDSITYGYGLSAGQTWLEQMALVLDSPAMHFTTYNSGVNSQTVADMLGNVSTEIDARYVAGARIRRNKARGNIAILFGGTNDLYFGASWETTLARQQAWVTGRVTAGFYVLFIGMLKRTQMGLPGTFESDRTRLNDYWQDTYRHARVRYVDACDDAAFSDTSDTDYFQDEIHPTAAGAQIIGRDYVAPAVLEALAA